VLVFDEGLHELVCGACGAPLHEMKMMPREEAPAPVKPKGAPAKKQRERREAPVGTRAEWRDWPAKKHERKRRKKKRKPLIGRVFEEVWDVVEDIFD